MNTLKIAVDGGASTGKTTVSREVAKELNVPFLTSGSMYRIITWIALEKGLENRPDELVELLETTDIHFEDNKLSVDMEGFVYSEIDGERVSAYVSEVCLDPRVRDYANRHFTKIKTQNPSIVIDGRDVGTIIMPEADIKFFLSVSNEEAAMRRFKQYESAGSDITYEEVLANVIERNEKDTNRKEAPLTKLEEAIEIDTSDLTQQEVIDKMLEIIRSE